MVEIQMIARQGLACREILSPFGSRRHGAICCVAAPRRYYGIACVVLPGILPGARSTTVSISTMDC